MTTLRSSAAAGAWLALCGITAYTMMAYDFRPGRLGAAPAVWPAESALPRSEDQLTVVAFLHPQCVCTQATVAHLARALKHQPAAQLVAAVFVPPGPLTPAERAFWEEGPYVAALRQAVPATRILYDAGGMEAQRFGALTSGTILLYHPDGRELFRGGITDRRGGEGENPGLTQLQQLIAQPQQPAAPTTPVFGCPLVLVHPHQEAPDGSTHAR